MKTIGLVDHTVKHKPAEGILAAIAMALSVQLTRDVAPSWNTGAWTVQLGSANVDVHLFDDPEQAGYLGYHDVDASGNPYARVFASPSIQAGSSWLSGAYAISTTVSHEAVEIVGDPDANLFAFDGHRFLWANELADPVEAETYTITARGLAVPLSDFVLPAFFNPFARGPYDHLGRLSRAFSLAPGGYAILTRLGREIQRTARHPFGVEIPRTSVSFGLGVPIWQRAEKLAAGTRTSWRRLLAP